MSVSLTVGITNTDLIDMISSTVENILNNKSSLMLDNGEVILTNNAFVELASVIDEEE